MEMARATRGWQASRYWGTVGNARIARSLRSPLPASIRWRLSAAISGVVLLCAALCVLGAVAFLSQTLTSRATTDLRHTLNGLSADGGTSGYLSDQRRDLLGLGELVVSDQSVIDDTLHQNQDGLIVDLSGYFADLNSVNVLDVIDAHGRVLVRMEDTLAYGDSVFARPLVRAALAGHEVAAVEGDLPGRETQGGYALRAAVPLHNGRQIIGAIVVGRKLDDDFATHIGNALNVQTNLLAGGRRTGRTLPSSRGTGVDGVAVGPETSRRIAAGTLSIATTTQNGHKVLSGLVPLADADGRVVGAVELISPLDPIYDVVTTLSLLLLALGAAVVVLGTTLALGLGSRLTARLLALEAIAAQVANRVTADQSVAVLENEVVVQGDDEVASLGRSFRAMMHALDWRMGENARLYAAAQARVRELTGLAQVARLLTATPSLQDTLERLSEHVCRLMNVAAVAIRIPSAHAGGAIYGSYGVPESHRALSGSTFSPSPNGDYQTVAQIAQQTGKVAWHRLADLPQSQDLLRAAAASMGWGGVTAVPLRIQERPIGVLVCYTTSDQPLPESDLRVLTTIADQVAVAVENGRLHERARDLAALDERARLARELHDSVTQALFSMTLHARAAQLAIVRAGLGADGPLARSVRQLNDLTQGALAEMRALIFELRPGSLLEEGLIAALGKQTAALSAREALPVQVEAPEERIPLEEETEEHLYRIAQEALHNAIKHAHAGRIGVRVWTEGDALILTIADDGTGFDTNAVHPGHLGLETMAERAHQIGGQLTISSAPGEGTTVRIAVERAVLGARAVDTAQEEV